MHSVPGEGATWLLCVLAGRQVGEDGKEEADARGTDGDEAQGRKIRMITAYDYPTALLVDQSPIEMILVGDSLGMVVLGYDSTVPVTMEDMLHHTRLSFVPRRTASSWPTFPSCPTR